MDELDTHLHFEMIPSILRFFTDTTTNKHGAQIIFTSHLTAIMKVSRYCMELQRRCRQDNYQPDTLTNCFLSIEIRTDLMQEYIEENFDFYIAAISTQRRSHDILADMASVCHSTYEHVIPILDNTTKPVIQAVRKNELSINAGYMITKLATEQQAEISQRIENGKNPAKVVSDVRKRKAASQEKTYKAVNVRLMTEEYEQVKALARANHTDIDSMITSLMREALSTYSEMQ